MVPGGRWQLQTDDKDHKGSQGKRMRETIEPENLSRRGTSHHRRVEIVLRKAESRVLQEMTRHAAP